MITGTMKTLARNLMLICGLGSYACNSSAIEFEGLKTQTFTSDISEDTSKDIFVFFDGTGNTSESDTNVYKLYKLLEDNAGVNTTALYIEGVGTTRSAPLTGSALGRGMEQRMLSAYAFVSNSFNKGDKIYLLGFSRGALQARSIAGLIAYSGLPIMDDEADITIKQANKVIETVKNYTDESFMDQWEAWDSDSRNPLAQKVSDRLGIPIQSANIDFVGVWDTVPGAALTNFDSCKQNIGFWKRHLAWAIPGVNKGERYKTDSYPNIGKISHAVSIDEKRSKFKQLLLCPPIVEGTVETSEIWFPGAHSDVGGGYSDSHELALISLDWMIQELSSRYEFGTIPEVVGDPEALAHWSMGDRPANTRSDCEDRELPSQESLHESYAQRIASAPVPVRVKDVERQLKYPLLCSDTLDNKAEFPQ